MAYKTLQSPFLQRMLYTVMHKTDAFDEK